MKKIVTSFLAAASLLALAGTSHAQTAPIRMGQTSTMQAIEQTDAVLARQTQRISGLETEIRSLTGRVENLEYRLNHANQNNAELEKENRALMERLARLEGRVDELASRPVITSSLPPASQSSEMGNPSSPSNGERPNWSGPGQSNPSTGPQDLRGGAANRNTQPDNGSPSVGRLPEGTLGTLPASRLPGNAGELFELGKNHLIAFNYEQAEAAFRKFLEEFGDDPQAGEAHYWLGETLYHQGDYAGSASFLTDMLKKYPNDARRGDALVKLARALREMGETDRACTFLSRLSDIAPDASEGTKQRVQQEQQRSNCG